MLQPARRPVNEASASFGEPRFAQIQPIANVLTFVRFEADGDSPHTLYVDVQGDHLAAFFRRKCLTEQLFAVTYDHQAEPPGGDDRIVHASHGLERPETFGHAV